MGRGGSSKGRSRDRDSDRVVILSSPQQPDVQLLCQAEFPPMCRHVTHMSDPLGPKIQSVQQPAASTSTATRNHGSTQSTPLMDFHPTHPARVCGSP
jgi:hypothetical protein